MNATAKPIQRPRLLRDGPVNIDEKTATFFVDKAMRAAAADLEADDGIEASIRRYGHSLGNVIGQRRFLDRMAKSAGCSTVYLGGFPSKKTFLMIRDILHVTDNRMMVTRTTASRRPRQKMDVAEWESFIISRHALIRAVERVQISSVEDVFALIKVMWMSIERLVLAIAMSKATTPGNTCWMLPMPMNKTIMGLLVARPTDDDLSLVTIYPAYMIADTLHAPMLEFLKTLNDTTMATNEKTRSDRLLAILPRLVV